MGISSKLSKKFKEFNSDKINRLIKMAWSDKVSFQEIYKQFGLTSNQVEKFMLYALPDKDYIRWKKRRAKRFNQKSRKAFLLKNN